jgi:hypothetical protein
MVREPDGEAIYDYVDRFREICLVRGGSIFWPEAQDAWSVSNLIAFEHAFIERPDVGSGNFWTKFQTQLDGQSVDISRIACEIQAFYSLIQRPADLKAATKQQHVLKIAEWNNLQDPAEDAWHAFVKASELGLASVGPFYKTGKYAMFAYYLRLFRRIRERLPESLDPIRLRDLADSVVGELKSDPNVNADLRQARHVALHLLEPNLYESSTSTSHKQRIVAAFREEAGIVDDLQEDDALARIRAYLEHKMDRQISFYEPAISQQWGGPTTQPPAPPEKPPAPPKGNNGGSIASKMFFNDAYFDELIALIRERKQVVFEGPPGSGKTFVAERIAHWLAGDPDRVRVVQFHQSYGYEDFVQGIRPRTHDGQLTYVIEDGIFKALCDAAEKDLDNTYVMLIDEINRGNISRIFGELLYLLEYRARAVTLTHGGRFAIPENVIVLGTMNSADRSLAQLDYALRRRFAFVRFMPVEHGRAPVLQGWLEAQPMTEGARRQVLEHFITLNARVSELLTADVQIGHSYYMRPGIDDPAVQERVWRFGVRPLLEEYFHHHRNREEVLAGFTPIAPMPPDDMDDISHTDDPDAGA